MQPKWLTYLQDHDLSLYADALVERRKEDKEYREDTAELRREVAELKTALAAKDAQIRILMQPAGRAP